MEAVMSLLCERHPHVVDPLTHSPSPLALQLTADCEQRSIEWHRFLSVTAGFEFRRRPTGQSSAVGLWSGAPGRLDEGQPDRLRNISRWISSARPQPHTLVPDSEEPGHMMGGDHVPPLSESGTNLPEE